jgi:hypothetical protein
VSAARGRWSLEALPGDERVRRWAVLRDGERQPHRRWLEALRDDADARGVLTEALRAAPFRAYLWETPAAVPGDDGTTAEMVVIDSPGLGRARTDPSAFAQAFRAANGSVATFANLGGDAVLVAPHPAHAPDSPHLGAFVRSASGSVVDALWSAVADAVSAWLAARDRPVWVSTSGLAVSWLHVRLDSVPKYYAHRAYAMADTASRR